MIGFNKNMIALSKLVESLESPHDRRCFLLKSAPSRLRRKKFSRSVTSYMFTPKLIVLEQDGTASEPRCVTTNIDRFRIIKNRK